MTVVLKLPEGVTGPQDPILGHITDTARALSVDVLSTEILSHNGTTEIAFQIEGDPLGMDDFMYFLRRLELAEGVIL